MYAVIKTGGKEYKVCPGDLVRVERLDAEAGSDLEIPDVLMVADGAKITVGRPVIESAKVCAQVVEHGRAKKVLIMKKKRRKGYKVKRGHRQPYSTLKIKEIRV